MTNTEDHDRMQKIRQRVKRLRNFYMSVITFFLINILLAAINLIASPDNLWFYWVTLIWGIALILQGIKLFTIKDQLLGEDWEKKKIKELLEKEKKK